MVTRYLHVHPAGRWAVLRMSGTNGRAWLTSHRLPAVWSTSRRGYLIRAGKLADVLAIAQTDGWRVTTPRDVVSPEMADLPNPKKPAAEPRLRDGNPELAAIIAELGGKCADCGRFICECEAAS